MDRMGDAFNPNRVVQDLYAPENIGKSGIAHHYMYGPGKQEQVKGPGIMGYARELALPFFSGSALDQSVQSNGLRQFQKMGSTSTMTATQQLFFVKEAIRKATGRLIKGIYDTATTMAKKPGAKIGDEILPASMLHDYSRGARVSADSRIRDLTRLDTLAEGAAKSSPQRLALAQEMRKARGATYQHKLDRGLDADEEFNRGLYNWKGQSPTMPRSRPYAGPAPAPGPASFWDDIKGRTSGAWDIAKQHPWHTGGAALAIPGMIGSFFGGRHSVSDGAYNAGYGAGSAGAAQMYSDQNPFARFGAAAFPDMAMNRVMQQYPDLMAAYQRAGSRRGQPAGSRSNYDANNPFIA
jgi:hypothetical protein